MLYKIKSKIESNWIDILDLKAVFITFSINKDFTLKYTSESLSFSVSTNQDIIMQPMERLCIFIDLIVVFSRPLIIFNLFDDNKFLCCFHEILRNGNMTLIEKIEFLNVKKS